MKDNLNSEKKDILTSFEKGGWVSLTDIDKRKQQLKNYARETIRKDKRVNIRISQRDLNELGSL